MEQVIMPYWDRRHPKQAEQQQQQQSLTTEEIKLVRDYALLSVMLSVVNKNRTEIEMSAYSLKPLYVAASDVLMKRMTEDLYAVRKALKRRGVQVIENGKFEGAIHYRLLYRGYESTFQLMRDIVRAEISLRLTRYIGDLFNLQEAR